jgi:hypothetical protein
VFQLLVDDEVDSGRRGEQFDGAVVVGRPEPAGDDTQVSLQPFPERGRELARLVTDDGDAGRSDPERQQLAGEERAVQVGALAADELAAGDDNRGARTDCGRAQWQETVCVML